MSLSISLSICELNLKVECPEFFYSNRGRGLSISFPESSQDMLKSFNTVRVRRVIICGAMTSLWIP